MALRRERSRDITAYFRPGFENAKVWNLYDLDPDEELPFHPHASATRRRVKLMQLPFHYGITEADLSQFLERLIAPGRVLKCTLLPAEAACVVETSTVESALALAARGTVQLLPGVAVTVSRIGLSLFSEENKKVNAKNAYQAHKAVMTALDLLSNRDAKTKVEEARPEDSTLLKVVDAVHSFDAPKLSEGEWQEYKEDLRQQLEKFGRVEFCEFVRQEGLALLRVGNLLVQYSSREEARTARERLQDRLFEGRQLKVFFFPEIAKELMTA